MNKEYLELYTDYLLSTFGHATATGLSDVVNGQVSHDQVTRFLAQGEYTSKTCGKKSSNRAQGGTGKRSFDI